ncbi:MAG: SDR family oxidoreductase [Candidatus Omnitrophica bacterium]|nr:SDR family oxidoreductase [Candidatus Omnitrophota bacterium]
MRLLITGANGFLGKKLIKVLSIEHEVIGTSSTSAIPRLTKLDLRSPRNIKKTLLDIKPDAIIHAAAITNIGYCEDNKRRARLVNIEGTKQLAYICKAEKIKMFYISTDYVFSGQHSPYSERKKAHPINYYGLTKLEAEESVKKILSDYCIIRPAILYGYNDSHNRGTFVTQVLNSLKAGKKIAVDNYRIKYPTLIDDVAKGFLWLLKEGKKGIFHFSNHQSMTRYQWALKIAEVFGYSPHKILADNSGGEKRASMPYKVELISARRLAVKFTRVKAGLKMIKFQMEQSS